MTRQIEPLSADERLALVAAARSFLGVPFLHQGRTTKGTDCVGLVFLALRAIGREPSKRIDYGRLPANQKLEAALQAHFGPPITVEPEPGDVVVMAWSGESCHVGIITPHPDRGIGLIHCYLTAQRVIEHGIDSVWRDRIVGVYRP